MVQLRPLVFLLRRWCFLQEPQDNQLRDDESLFLLLLCCGIHPVPGEFANNTK
jgi:hypothetical protein